MPAPGRPSPHDALFRRVLGEPEHAASELRSVLPPSMIAGLELDTLVPVAGSFVDEALRWRHCDVLFTARCRGRAALVYVLMEHQSTPDPWMAWRMWQYVTRIWEDRRRRYPNERRLPLVIPLVVYRGHAPWRHPTDLIDLLDVEPEWATDPLLPQFSYLLDDLTTVDASALRARPLTAPARVALLLLTRVPANPGIVRELTAWIGDLRGVLDRPGGIETFRALVTYIELAGEAPPEDLRNLMEQVGPDAEEAYMTTADMLRAEGEARGLVEGEARGEARGRAEALLQLLALRFGRVPDSTVDVVRAAPVDRIAAWTERVLTAATLDDVLG